MAENSTEQKVKSGKTWRERLTARYRLVLLNDETFEEVTSFQLTRMNVYVLVSTILVILVLVTVSAIIYTPVKQYIPGYADVNMRRDVLNLKVKSDSLEKAVIYNEQYLQNLRRIINGDLPAESIDDTSIASTARYDTINPSRISYAEEQLRQDVEERNRFAVNTAGSSTAKTSSSIRGFIFFTPVKGYITQPFNASRQHYGVDIVAPENEPIKSALDGMVVFSGWMSETGYVIAIQHSNNLLTVYKHNSVLLKQQGSYVKAGDVIAIIGNTGEYSTGPHLHFEIWYNGLPLNPELYIAFQ